MKTYKRETIKIILQTAFKTNITNLSQKKFQKIILEILKNKFNKLKDVVFGSENEEYKQKMIKDNNSNSNNISSNSVFQKKPITAPTNIKAKSPLRSLINNHMGLIFKNQNIN